MKEILFKGETSETMCQYIGLTDKNGNKVFENDIVSCGLTRCVIKYNDYHACFMFFDMEGYPLKTFTADTLKNWEVIGNIFDI